MIVLLTYVKGAEVTEEERREILKNYFAYAQQNLPKHIKRIVPPKKKNDETEELMPLSSGVRRNAAQMKEEALKHKIANHKTMKPGMKMFISKALDQLDRLDGITVPKSITEAE